MNEFVLRLMLTTFLRAPDDEGARGGSGGGDGAGAGDGGKGGGSDNPFGKPSAGGGDPKAGDGGGKPNDAPAGGPYFPKDFPDHLKGTNDRETIDKIYGAFSGMRTDMSKRGSVPKEAAGYELKLSEHAAKMLGEDTSKDRSAQIFRNLALKYELSDKQAAGIFHDMMDENISAGVIKFIDPLQESKIVLGDAAVGRTDQEVLEQVAGRWETLKAQVDGMVAKGAVAKEGADVAKKLMDTGAGLLFLEKLVKMTGEHGLQLGGQSGGGGITKADLDKRINDPRANPMHPLYDEAFEKETNRLGEAFYGNQNQAA